MLFCANKKCIHNEWNMFYGTFCNERNVQIDTSGKCTKKLKITKEQLIEKRKRYGFKDLY